MKVIIYGKANQTGHVGDKKSTENERKNDLLFRFTHM